MLMYLLPSAPIHVSIHLEEFNKRYGLLHIGVSFENEYKELRYDFKRNADNYLTYSKNKMIPWKDELIETDYIPETYDILTNSYSKDENIRLLTLNWGITNYTFEEIKDYEKTLHNEYKLGFYDCRHYVRKFTKWATGDPTPIWRLKTIWKNNINNY